MKNLRTLRLRDTRHLSQARLAELANEQLPELPPFEIDQQYIAAVETGKNRNPNNLAAMRIAAALGVSPSDLYSTVAQPAPVSVG